LRKEIGEAITWLIVVLIIGGFAFLLVSVWSSRSKADVDPQPRTFVIREDSNK
jgi:uncharacterized membrane-anchored protein